ncbi:MULTISPECIES: AraC family transcriptional regulator [Cyclobacterium]|jgi:YesN/AraC family two-component response regulator|uniref:Transcriptional regulator, AraC family n=1 Tax=Cyclobacterium marinum (strain ATCC 25205 / DSM 745 / LMG 13164 / NCIMB 1802) TaxID=880070 RepID=G0J1S2_CYCMS|nr:AraC family transcriptional regulator [Cyclobacterium marinum]AEL28281.1 transcriptional regulator, AraC family [Cyclobacterium marinum DSM 745]|tara:strand:+ start:2787 stop:3365 length:579 start_codon:yes stop_codon:yes gene_type:complete
MITKLHIKNMVSPSCILVVENELKVCGVDIQSVRLGCAEVIISATISLEEIDLRIKKFGFELIYDKKTILIEQIKIAVLDYLKFVQKKPKNNIKLSAYISSRIDKNYNYLSKVFSKETGETLEKYYIHIRIEKVKEFLEYGQLNVSEIAIKLGYSSVHYLSNQFKKVTGFSISAYKKRGGTDSNSQEGLPKI